MQLKFSCFPKQKHTFPSTISKPQNLDGLDAELAALESEERQVAQCCWGQGPRGGLFAALATWRPVIVFFS